ncbi:UNVERIFIED_CONTAM: hypothetical protein Sindi_1483700, partial [Sesamum indicum]
VLNGDIPCSCLYPDRLLFSVTPRVFGYVCCPYTSRGLDKLCPRYIKCIFLGYSH